MATDETDTPTSGVRANISVKIIVKVRRPDGTYMIFKIARATPLAKLMRKYCERYTIDWEDVVFRFEGTGVAPTDTASSLGIDDGDSLDAYHST